MPSRSCSMLFRLLSSRAATSERLQLEVRIAQLEDDRVRLDERSREHAYPLDASVGGGRDPADVLRDERAEPAHVAQHRAALDGVHEDARPIDARRRRLEPREP